MGRRKIDPTENIITDKEMRDKCVNHYEVLKKTKQLLLLPDTDFMTVKQVADYYEVGKDAIESIYLRHKGELLEDGMLTMRREEFLNLQHEGFENVVGKTIISMQNGVIVEVPNRGLKVFPLRAVLRIGMLLRDSEIAKEVRSQLLNIEEKVSDEVKVMDINEEQKLAMELGMAMASGNTEAIAFATGNMMAFKNRHIAILRNDKGKRYPLCFSIGWRTHDEMELK